jgi:hypothetical protein
MNAYCATNARIAWAAIRAFVDVRGWLRGGVLGTRIWRITMAEYDLKSLALPKLSGAGLRGFARFRALRLDEPPTFLPLAGGLRRRPAPCPRPRSAGSAP